MKNIIQILEEEYETFGNFSISNIENLINYLSEKEKDFEKTVDKFKELESSEILKKTYLNDILNGSIENERINYIIFHKRDKRKIKNILQLLYILQYQKENEKNPSKETNLQLYNTYAKRKNKSKEFQEKIEEIWKKYSQNAKTEDELLQDIINYQEKNEKNPSKETNLQLYNTYVTRKNKSKEFQEKIEEIWKKYSQRAKTEDELLQDIINYQEKNGENPSQETHLQLYNTYANRKNKSKEFQEKIEEIWKKYSQRAKTEDELLQDIIDYQEKNGENPSYKTHLQLYNTYAKRKNKSKEFQEKIEEIWKKYSKPIEQKIKEIELILQSLISSIVENNNIKDLIPSFSEIEELYSSFEKNEKVSLKKYNKNINELCEHIEKKEYSKITNTVLLNISKKIIDEIKDNPEKNGKYLAWQLNKDLYINPAEQNIEYTKEEEEEDLYRLKNIIDFLNFESKEKRKEIIGGFNIFLTNILIKNGKDTKSLSEAVPSVIAEVKNHIITFFENFNENDFKELKKELLGKSEEEFLDVILNKINNSTLTIPNKSMISEKSYNKPQPVFKKKSNGKWYYALSTSGKLDLYASYNKKIITASTTTNDDNGFEGSQLLIHPIKENLISKEAKNILTKEIKIGNNDIKIEDLENWVEFNKDSIFYGLSLKRTKEGNLYIKIANKEILEKENKQFWRELLKDEYDDNLLENQIKNMNSLLLINKIILESGKFRVKKENKEKQNRLMEYRKNIIEISSLNNMETIKKYVSNKNLENNKLTEKECIEVLGNHTFDFQSLTLATLNQEENELLIEMWLKKEFLFYEKFVSDETDITKVMFENIKLRNPLIKIDLKVMYENNKAEEFIKFIVNLLNTENFENSLSEGVEKSQLIDKIINNLENNENLNMFISDKFIKTILTQGKQKILLSLIIEYINKLRKTNPKYFKKLEKNHKFIQNIHNLFIETTPSIQKLKKQMLFINENQNINQEEKQQVEKEKNEIIQKLAMLLGTTIEEDNEKVVESIKNIALITTKKELDIFKKEINYLLKDKKDKKTKGKLI